MLIWLSVEKVAVKREMCRDRERTVKEGGGEVVNGV
jgi:hypothetical protein